MSDISIDDIINKKIVDNLTQFFKNNLSAWQFMKNEIEKPQKIEEVMPNCNMCGTNLVKIRGKYPKTPNRIICPCCFIEKLEDFVSSIECQTPKQDVKFIK